MVKKLVSKAEFTYVDFFNGFLAKNQAQNGLSGGGRRGSKEKDRLFYSVRDPRLPADRSF